MVQMTITKKQTLEENSLDGRCVDACQCRAIASGIHTCPDRVNGCSPYIIPKTAG